MADTPVLTLKRWLIISQDGVTSLKMNQPSVQQNEIAMQLEINLPKALFTKPMLRAVITIPATAGAPATLDVDTVSDMEAAIHQALGMKLSITVVPPPSPDADMPF